MSIIERVSSGQGFIIHYVGYIWDSVSVHYREGVLWSGVYYTLCGLYLEFSKCPL